ncbi:DUF2252 domain-containing protein [Mycobacterium sp. PSTR-4-N]|uniref:DUF2252 domain-containing protein n=1 Tax=Mycobacterium sp. PSTR-4-N TaxID=2917745 RepID=UPI001F150F14|nr:DUF2252 family protein [Mycobacterium sp. PSTR-4-N]MCG7595681.1 DUF2252 domain-containing protein [Mycobacterium sp. PSTR-4-N]
MDDSAATRKELLNTAKALGVEVPATARKKEIFAALAAATGDPLNEEPPADDGGIDETDAGGRVSARDDEADGSPRNASRMKAFQALAHTRAAGHMVVLPSTLTGNDRRMHVRQTIREDHQLRIARHNEEAFEKFDKLARSRFSFFRGTALMFYRDMAGEDAWLPTVLAAGDVHPENFGVMPNADNVPIFGINDYDEVFYAPFTWDLKRGATGFMIAADEIGDFGRGKRRKIARSFVRGYVDKITAYASDHNESVADLRRDNAPELIADLIDSATDGTRAEWLAEKYYNETRTGFKSSKKLVPITSRRNEFQELINRYVEESGLSVPARAGSMKVKDVVERRGQGTASLGLVRYYVMIEGPLCDASDDILLELKQARRSALDGVVPPSEHLVDGDADRVVHGQRVQLVSGDRFYGSIKHRGISFLVRERSWYRDDIDLDDLSFSEWRDYAKICGEVVAQAHALSDEAGLLDYDVEPDIVAAIGTPDLFADDVVRFAEEASDRNKSDHKAFRKDHALGAFRRIDLVYR